jgi:O-antigen/teichoic acid export membrane protein
VAGRLTRAGRQFGGVGLGLAVLGLASFAFLSVSGRALGPAELAPLGTLWILINALGPALFQPLEQEVGRAVAEREVHGLGARPVLLRAGALALGTCLALGILLVLVHRPLASAFFAGEDVLVLALGLGVSGLAAQHLTRGAFAGTGQLTRYGTQLAADGCLRIGSAAALAVVGVSTVGPYGLLLGLAPLFAVLLTTGRPGPLLRAGPPVPWRRLLDAIGWLTVGSIASQFLVNAAPVAANLLADADDQARVGIFISVLVLARMPLFLFAAVQASLVPRLAASAAAGDSAGFARQLRSLTVLVTGVGALGVLTVLAAGPWLVTVIYGPEFHTTRGVLVTLALASTVFMAASVFGQTLISVREYRPAAAGWACGAAAFVLWLLLPLTLEIRVGGAFLAGSSTATVAIGWLLWRRLRRPLPALTHTAPAADQPVDGSSPWT